MTISSQYFFPYRFARENNFVEHLSAKGQFEDFCRGRIQSFSDEKGNFSVSRRHSGITKGEQYRREYLWNEFQNWKKWMEGGRQTVLISPLLLQKFQTQEVLNIELEHLTVPFDNFFLSLKDLQVAFEEGTLNYVDGVYIKIEKNTADDPESTYEYALTLDFSGDYEAYATKYNDSISECFNFSFKTYTLYLDKVEGIKTVKEALDNDKEFFRQELLLNENGEDKLIDAFQFRQDLILKLIAPIINAIKSMTNDEYAKTVIYPDDVPRILEEELLKICTRQGTVVGTAHLAANGYGLVNLISPIETRADNASRRIAYHEAGHAYVAMQVGYTQEIQVVVYDTAQGNHLGLTSYLKDKFKNLMTDVAHGFALLQIACAGCAGEQLFCLHENQLYDGCKYGQSDNEFIKMVQAEMLRSPSENQALLSNAISNAARIVVQHPESIQAIATLLLVNRGKIQYFSDLSSALQSPRAN